MKTKIIKPYRKCLYHYLGIFLIVCSFALFFSCSSGGGNGDGDGGSDGDYSNCEMVVNAQGPGFLKVVNKSDDYILVFLPEYAFGAEVQPHVCEIYGLTDGTRRVEISRCDGEGCEEEYDTQKSSFILELGETHIIEITDDYFKSSERMSVDNSLLL